MCATWTHLLPRESVIGRKRDRDSRVEVSAGDVARAGDESHDQSSPGDAHARESDLAMAGLIHYDHAAADEDEEEEFVEGTTTVLNPAQVFFLFTVYIYIWHIYTDDNFLKLKLLSNELNLESAAPR